MDYRRGKKSRLYLSAKRKRNFNVQNFNREMANYSPEFLKEFFELYKSYPCMWDKTSAEYQDLSRKHDAMTSLLEKFREINAEATQELVEKKIADFTTFYGKVRERLRRTLAKGAKTSKLQERWYCGDDWSFLDLPPEPVQNVIQPNTDAFLIGKEMDTKEPIVARNLETTEDQILVPTLSSTQSNTNTINNIVKQEIELKEEIIEDGSSEEIYLKGTLNPDMDPLDNPSASSSPVYDGEHPASCSSTTVITEGEDLEAPSPETFSPHSNGSAAEEPPAVPSSSGGIPRKNLILHKNISRTNTSTPDRPVTGQKDRYSAFGEYVAMKLCNVRPDQTILAERFMNEVLYHAEIGDLDDNWKFFRVPFSTIELASYNPDFLKQFLELYKSYPCIWDKTSAEYQDLPRKDEAMSSLLAKFREINAEATREFVEKKITDLTIFYRKEREKLRLTLAKDGSKCNLQDRWYFGEDLSFLDLPPELVQDVVQPSTTTFTEEEMDIKKPVVACSLKTAQDQISVPTTSSTQSNTSSINDIVKQEIELKEEIIEDDVSEDINPVETSNPKMDSLDNPGSSSSAICAREQPASSSSTTVIITEDEDLEPPVTGQKDRLSAFGRYVAAKLRNVQLGQTILAERFMNEILYHAEIGVLDDNWKFLRLPFSTLHPTDS